MSFKLSIVMPVYNFAHFLPETLDTILDQEKILNVQIVVFDGGSSDDTPEVIRRYQQRYNNIKYVRRNQRGGIDRDMASAVSSSDGEFCWLFSGDDLMLPGAVCRIFNQLAENCDLYLTRHMEWVDYHKEWVLWPTVNVQNETIFDLLFDKQRLDYFSRAETTEAFFSFIGGIVVRRALWETIEVNEKFVGSCWAHVARLFEIMQQKLLIKVLNEAYLQRRPDNDSFAHSSVTARFKLTIDGFTKIAETFYPPGSIEYQSIIRVLRTEYHPLNMLLGKYLCLIDPEHENIQEMDRMLKLLYGDHSYSSWSTRLKYYFLTISRFRKWQPEVSKKYDKIKGLTD